MNSLVLDSARRALFDQAGVRSAGIGVVVVLLVLFLIVERELLRALTGAATEPRVRLMAPIVGPLLAASIFILVVRFARLI